MKCREVSVMLLVAGGCVMFAVACDSDDESEVQAETKTTIGEQGGVAESEDGHARLDFPEGALEGDHEVTIQTLPDPDRDDLHTGLYGFDIDTSLNESVTVEIDVTGTPDEGANLALARFDGETPQALPSANISGTLTADLLGFSAYGGFDIPQEEPEMPEKSTVIPRDEGGVAESEDGNLRITFPPEAYTIPDGAVRDELEVTIATAEEVEGGMDEPYRASEEYAVRGTPRGAFDKLDKPAEIALDLSEAPGDRRVELRTFGGEGDVGLVTAAELDGQTIAGESTKLGGAVYFAVAFDITDRCDAIDPAGRSCEEPQDCKPSDADSPNVMCVCEDGEEKTSHVCHGGTCISALAACAGIGTGHEGWCEDAGGWTGDCYHTD